MIVCIIIVAIIALIFIGIILGLILTPGPFEPDENNNSDYDY